MNVDLFVLVSVSFPDDQLHCCIYRTETSSSLDQNCCLLETILGSVKSVQYNSNSLSFVQRSPGLYSRGPVPLFLRGKKKAKAKDEIPVGTEASASQRRRGRNKSIARNDKIATLARFC